MPQQTGRIYDEFAKLMTDAAGVAEGVRRDLGGILVGGAERDPVCHVGDEDFGLSDRKSVV